jgi:hypothetical protein
MTPSTIDVTAALSRLRAHVGEAAVAELLAVAASVAAAWPGPTTHVTLLPRTFELTRALEARAPAAWASAQAGRDRYLARQIHRGPLHGPGPSGPLDDLLALVGAGPELDAALEQAITDLTWLRDALAAPAKA